MLHGSPTMAILGPAFLGRAVAQAPISGYFRPSVLCLSLLASGEVSRVAIGFKAVQSESGAARR